MPVHTPSTVQRETGQDIDDPCGPYEALLFSDSGGLTQFGARVEILPPGSASALAHWHAEEDEMVYVLDGTVDLYEGPDLTRLGPGDAATFKAGVALAHRLINRSNAPAQVLVIGTRSNRDTVTYPDHDRVLHRDRANGKERYTTLAGAPADPL